MKASQSRQGFRYIFKAGDRECTPVGQFFPLPPNHYKCSVNSSVHLSVHVADTCRAFDQRLLAYQKKWHKYYFQNSEFYNHVLHVN